MATLHNHVTVGNSSRLVRGAALVPLVPSVNSQSRHYTSIIVIHVTISRLVSTYDYVVAAVGFLAHLLYWSRDF